VCIDFRGKHRMHHHANDNGHPICLSVCVCMLPLPYLTFTFFLVHEHRTSIASSTANTITSPPFWSCTALHHEHQPSLVRRHSSSGPPTIILPITFPRASDSIASLASWTGMLIIALDQHARGLRTALPVS
jgi:hypothetical protein